MICVVIPGPSYHDVKLQVSAALPHADLIELRLDLFEKIDIAGLKIITESFSVPFIFTLKGQGSGGNFKGSEEQLLNQIRLLVKLKPAFLDLDHNTPTKFISEIVECYPGIKLILSYHNFSEMPRDLTSIYTEMLSKPANIHKFSVKVNSSLESLKVLVWAKIKSGNILVVNMGEYGQISRILQPILGEHFTYASLSSGLKTAEGQLSVKTLKEVYAYKKMNEKTKIFCLIGNPVDMSLSHVTHNHYFRTEGINAVYVKMPVAIDDLPEFFELAKKLQFAGFSVTMPLKEAVVPLLDWIDPQAQKIGACNTIAIRDGKLCGYNTDSFGALNAIERYVPVKEKRAVIIGAGGAAKAIAYEAVRRGVKVTILNRNSEKARKIAEQLGCLGMGLDSMEMSAKEGYDILINCIPISMPIDPIHILKNALVMDIKTREIDSPFLKIAKERNCRIVYGYEMFIEQAIGQFDEWFGHQVNQKICRQVLHSKIRKLLKMDKLK